MTLVVIFGVPTVLLTQNFFPLYSFCSSYLFRHFKLAKWQELGFRLINQSSVHPFSSIQLTGTGAQIRGELK